MFKLDVGAVRPATDEARSLRLSAANDLVQRTLAQHGIIPAAVDANAGAAQPAFPAMFALMNQLKMTHRVAQSSDRALPTGAEFRHDSYSCQAGTRAFRTYIPSTASAGVTGLVVMLHGCMQNPEDFAGGTGMNALAETHRFIVIYPAQSRGNNAQSCWNWFSRGDQRRDKGEPAILAGITRSVAADHGIAKDRTFVAGLSAGAAMALILGETYPDIYAAVGAHSGLPFGSAKDVPSAFAAMAGNALDALCGDGDNIAVRTIVFHGTDDQTVHPSNGDLIARHVMDKGAHQTIETVEQGETAGRSFTRKVTRNTEGASTLEHWAIDGLGHAWSGGQPGGSYTDQAGPDASAEMIRFFFNVSDEGL